MDANQENEAFFLKLVEDGRLIVCEDGTIFNAKTLKLYDRQNPTDGGPIHIAAKDRGKVRHILAHRLVYLVLCGPLDPTDEIIHNDGNKKNNAAGNLIKTNASGVLLHSYAVNPERRASLADKLRHRYDHELHPSAKLTIEQAAEIRRRFIGGETKARLSEIFDIDRKAVIKICRGESYKASLA